MGKELNLETRVSPGARVEALGTGGWRLSIPQGPAGAYRWAQIDDYMAKPRRKFTWQAPVHLRLQARVSHPDLPGTWGFGFWNDPFSFNFGVGGAYRRLPAPPNTAWFFYAAPPNYLSLRDDLPAQGFLAATFRSLAWAGPAARINGKISDRSPLLWFGRCFRRLARRVVPQAACQVAADATAWHTYEIAWKPKQVDFLVDGETILQTAVAPRGRLGLVLWIDNQYAAFHPRGTLAFGTSPSPHPAWLELNELSVS